MANTAKILFGVFLSAVILVLYVGCSWKPSDSNIEEALDYGLSQKSSIPSMLKAFELPRDTNPKDIKFEVNDTECRKQAGSAYRCFFNVTRSVGSDKSVTLRYNAAFLCGSGCKINGAHLGVGLGKGRVVSPSK